MNLDFSHLLGLGGGPQSGLFNSTPAAPGMADPASSLFLNQAISSNPGIAAAALAASGVPPPSPVAGDVNLGSYFDPASFPEGITTALGGQAGFSPMGAPANAGPGASGIPGLGAMAGVKAPPPVAAPIFNAGVSGSQKAPELQSSAAGGQNMLQLLSLLQKAGGPAATPAKPLGAYF